MTENEAAPPAAVGGRNGPFLLAAGVVALGAAAAMLAGSGLWAGTAFAAAWALAALHVSRRPSSRTFAFTFWVFAFFTLSLARPSLFTQAAGFDQRALIEPLIQIIMFGMGATLSSAGFWKGQPAESRAPAETAIP